MRRPGPLTVHVIVQALAQSALGPFREFIKGFALVRQRGSATSGLCGWPTSRRGCQTRCGCSCRPRHSLWCCDHRSGCFGLAPRADRRPRACRTRRRGGSDFACQVGVTRPSRCNRYHVGLLSHRGRCPLFPCLFLLLDLSKRLFSIGRCRNKLASRAFSPNGDALAPRAGRVALALLGHAVRLQQSPLAAPPYGLQLPESPSVKVLSEPH